MGNLFAEKFIRLNYPAVDKKSLLQEMTSSLFEEGVISSADSFFNEIWKRETIMSTGLGRGIAVPHSCNHFAKRFVVSVWKLADAIEFDSIDEKPVSMVFLVAVPMDKQNQYMKILSAISNFIRHKENIQKINSAQDRNQLLDILNQINIQT